MRLKIEMEIVLDLIPMVQILCNATDQQGMKLLRRNISNQMHHCMLVTGIVDGTEN